MEQLYYVGYFDSIESRNKHFVSPAGSKKMEYVAEALASSDVTVSILSAARPECNHFGYCKTENLIINKNVKVLFFGSIVGKFFIIKQLSSLWILIRLFFFLLSHLKRNSFFVVYHSMAYVGLIVLLKRLTHARMILEVEEVYSDVSSVSSIMTRIENKVFKMADAYVFPTELINTKVNIDNKPSIIIYGNYNVPKIQKDRINDGKIHIVYSGTFNARKGGVFTAIQSAEFLSSKYCFHITGMGTPSQVDLVSRLIEDIKTRSDCAISYDGFVRDEEFIPYLQQFHIGISSQNPDDKLSSSCFPSKILVYLSNGLTVLSSRAPAVLNSSISKYLYFYDNSSAQSIAEQIMRISPGIDNRGIIQGLDNQCKKEMIAFLKALGIRLYS